MDCFNEASALQRRKRPRSPPRRCWPPRFNEASALQRRKLRSSAAFAAEVTSFNEASALQRRKPLRRPEPLRGPHASMRPPLFSGGNRARRGRRVDVDAASMRPPLFSGGNAYVPPGPSMV